jgi:hypothetical protein
MSEVNSELEQSRKAKDENNKKKKRTFKYWVLVLSYIYTHIQTRA